MFVNASSPNVEFLSHHPAAKASATTTAAAGGSGGGGDSHLAPSIADTRQRESGESGERGGLSDRRFSANFLSGYDRNSHIPLFHVALVTASLLLIVCALLTAFGIYLRVLHVARRNAKRRSLPSDADDAAISAANRRGVRQSAPAALLGCNRQPPPLRVHVVEVAD